MDSHTGHASGRPRCGSAYSELWYALLGRELLTRRFNRLGREELHSGVRACAGRAALKQNTLTYRSKFSRGWNRSQLLCLLFVHSDYFYALDRYIWTVSDEH